ncbi:hypothetical protein C9374_008439 [Naegleria lovaniensis]|uniref:Uncharacterized protein n=1 Tax=Naegleria lovaniensis TaxID=51637 RepID=A0AA88KHL3_NAELO|nr:uncharacterized protein C9374_008439 [Naegleria lovaniensis]KAG2378296.1 hypothetical protein C9374_008439 [Naegleria lovaniensis]
MSKGKTDGLGTFGMRWKETDPSLIVNNDRIWRNAIKTENAIRNSWTANFDFLVDENRLRLEKMANELTNEKLQKQNYNYSSTDQLTVATVRRAINSDEILPKPPHLENKKPGTPKKSKMESYYQYTLPPQKLNPSELDPLDIKKNISKLEETEKLCYSLTPTTTIHSADLYNKKELKPSSKDQKKHRRSDREGATKDDFDASFKTMLSRKNEGRAKEDLSLLSNSEYGSLPTLETFGNHYTKYGRKKFVLN